MSRKCSTPGATPGPQGSANDASPGGARPRNLRPISGASRIGSGVGAAGIPGAFLCRALLWVSAGLLPSLAPDTEAHPAHSKPVNYPYVVGFERFHSSLDDDERLAEGGLLLLNELNCVACHEPPAPWRERLPGTEATDLRGVASRLDPVDLEIMIRNPRFLKRDTMMPSLFSGPDRDLAELEALKHYLMAQTVDLPERPPGDAQRGRRLFHRIGCVACHAPEVGYRPESLPEGIAIELTGLPSVPMNLADRYSSDALTAFLLDPLSHRPSGRMPDFGLSEGEAVDLAAYLKIEGEIPWPLDLARAFGEEGSAAVDPGLERRGRDLFVSKQCAACHTPPHKDGRREAFPATPLASIDPDADGGCFAERPPGGQVPFFGLDPVQKRAVALALNRLREPPGGGEALDFEWRMKRLNCYACHQREGRGGAEIPREIYFGSESRAAMSWGRRGHLPPSLDGVGAKLDEGWLEDLLLGGPGEVRARPWLSARMPRYRPEAVAPLFEALPRLDGAATAAAPDPVAGTPLDPETALQVLRERACLDCHPGRAEQDRGAHPEGGGILPGIDLALSGDRMRAEAFGALLLAPKETQEGTPLPPLFADTPADRELLRSLWLFLAEPEEE